VANWRIKAVVQKIISFFPRNYKINYLFQKYVTKGVLLSDEYFYDRLGHAEKHAQFFYTEKNNYPDSTLELGTGWYPVVPIAMFLLGADTIYTIDITPLSDKEKLITTLKKFTEAIKNNKINTVFLRDQTRVNKIISLSETGNQYDLISLLNKLNITYLKADARSLPFDIETFDFIHSNNTLEHIYENILTDILTEFKRIQKSNGLQSHFIDMSDHFAHADHSITIYNYLKFNESKWVKIDNSVQPQNRLRINQYRDLYKKSGLQLIKEECRPGDIKELNKITLSEPFNSFDKNDVAISHAYLLSK
jgi:SAM-dependent methyltransferase